MRLIILPLFYVLVQLAYAGVYYSNPWATTYYVYPPVASNNYYYAKPLRQVYIDNPGDTSNNLNVAQIIESLGVQYFRNAVKTAELRDKLSKEEGPFTVFVPLDSTFLQKSTDDRKKLEDPDTAKELVESHIVEGRHYSFDIKDGLKLTALGGNEIPVARQPWKPPMVGDSHIIKTNLWATNGVVHIIDKPLIEMKKEK